MTASVSPACRPSVRATRSVTSAPSASDANSTHHTPPGKRSATRAATCRASLVLPQPPAPVNVTSRDWPSSRAPRSRSSARPTNVLNSAGRLLDTPAGHAPVPAGPSPHPHPSRAAYAHKSARSPAWQEPLTGPPPPHRRHRRQGAPPAPAPVLLARLAHVPPPYAPDQANRGVFCLVRAAEALGAVPAPKTQPAP